MRDEKTGEDIDRIGNKPALWPHRAVPDGGGSIENQHPNLDAHIVGFTLRLLDGLGTSTNSRLDVVATFGESDKDKTVRKHSAAIPDNPWGRVVLNILNIKPKMTPASVITLSNGKPIRITVTRTAPGGTPEPIWFFLYDFIFCSSV
ncbi:hypothetical protein TWF281_002170 [Arthrobotrys megalospora]